MRAPAFEHWVKKHNAMVPPDWDVEAYRARVRFFREYHSPTQVAFSKRAGIPFKAWNNYERGYPLSMRTALKLRARFADFSIEWLWFGRIGTLQLAFYDAAVAAGVPQETHKQFERRRDHRDPRPDPG